MAYVITRLCRDCIDSACVSVCPEPECIVEHKPPAGAEPLPNQLFINPDQCIDCGACQPECPWEAIFPEDDVPAPFVSDIALNAIAGMRPEEFEQASERTSRTPSTEEIEANKRRWLQQGGSPETKPA